MNNKVSSYHKLKSENLRLKQELLKVAIDPDSSETIHILMKYKMLGQVENSVWFGNTDDRAKYAGIINSLCNNAG